MPIDLSLLKYPKTVSYKLFLGFCNIANKIRILPQNWQKILDEVRCGNKKPVEAVRELGISRSYFYKIYSDN